MFDDLAQTVGGLLGGIVGARLGPNARRRAYRNGEPVFMRATFEGVYPWATELLCRGHRLWVVSNRRFGVERRTEIVAAERAVEVDRKVRWSTGPTVTLNIDGQSLRISTTTDFDLLVEATAAWQLGTP